MNANQARPLAAFAALAVAAAVITGVGLRAQTRDVTVSAGSPTPVRTAGAPELVLGGVLRGQPGGILANPLSPDLWSPPTPAASAGTGVQVAAPATTKARSHGGEHAEQVATSTTTTTATKTAVNGSGKPRKDPPGQTKATATATATPTTDHGHGKGSGTDHSGKGR